MKQLLPILSILLLAFSLAGQTLPQSRNLGGGCTNRQNETVFPSVGLNAYGTHVIYLFDYAQGGPSFMVFDVLGGLQLFYPTPLSLVPFGTGHTCFLRVQWCAVTSSLISYDGSFPIPTGWHGSLRCQQMILDSAMPGGFYMSDVAELVL